MRIAAVLLWLAGLAAPAVADPLPVGREDLGRAWLRMERTLQAHPPKPEVRKRLGDAFDVKTLAFFRGGFREVVRGIDAITAELRGISSTDGPGAFALAFRLDFDPPVWVIGRTERATMTGGALYEVAIDDAGLGKLRIRLLDPAGRTQMEMPVRSAAPSGTASLAAKGLEPGVHEYRIVGPGIDEPAGRVVVMREHPEEIRARNEKRIAALPEDAPPRAVACVRARNALIVTKPSPAQSYTWISDPHSLSVEVGAELDALAKGKDPYRGRTGDRWALVDVEGDGIPYRIFVPDSVGEKPVPLVVALHGAGADENAFFEGYGAGRIRDLAAQRGFIVVAPRTLSVARKPGAFPALVDAIAEDYAIDPARVYVLGHSLGGMATGLFARAHGDRIAAACQMAGGRGRTGRDGPPILFVHAGQDRVVRTPPPPESALVTVRRYADEAHTFVVGKALPAAIDWLLEHPKEEKK
jgi:pimeloyl-ACP methyl ester carboxylesterase